MTTTTTFQKVDDIFQCKLMLEDNAEYVIPLRDDGYIHATKLCKVAKKKISNWSRLKETKDLINKLESDAHIRASQLIEIYKGNSSKYSQGTWVHPDLGIHLAQWCNPNFSLQVSKWIKELIFTGSVEIGKEKDNDEIVNELKKQLEMLQNQNKDFQEELENKNKELLYLNNTISRAQQREKCDDNYVVYILTCDDLEKDGIYIIGKAVDLVNRITGYNKSLEYRIVYKKSFKNLKHMNTAEMMVLYKLNNYRQKDSKKDRFVLPENSDISLFTNVIDEASKWFNIENSCIENTSLDVKNEESDYDGDGEFNKIDKEYTHEQIRKLCKEKDIIQTGNKRDMIHRIIEYNRYVDEEFSRLDKTYNYKQIQKLCKEQDILHYGHKSDMIKLIIEKEIYKNKTKKTIRYKPNTVYMLTSEIHKKNRMYIIGKSINLNGRLSGYNKGVDHIVTYNKTCKNSHQMDIVELMILYKFDTYRERTNRDRFILPDDKNESFFTNVFDDAIKWFDNIDENVIIVKDEETKQQERKDKSRDYRQLNKEKISDIDKQYRQKNKEKIQAKTKIYIEENKEKVSDVKKDWYKRNKEKVIERVKNNYHNNKITKIETVKKYSIKNKDKIQSQQKITVTCECGLVVRKYGLSKHLKTAKHITKIEELSNELPIDEW